MTFEVELKYRLSDAAAIEQRLAKAGATLDPPQSQIDRYYAHPARDFAATDEALRIRSVGDANYVTYKGPKQKTASKTRREIEIPVGEGEPARAKFAELLEALGFTPVAEVRKQRRRGTVLWNGQHVEIALDDVSGLGAFIELELIADERALAEAQACILSLAESFQLGPTERRSYLEMLREKTRRE